MNFAKQSQGSAVRPPLKGSFPLDHYQECQQQMDAFMECMKRSGNDNHVCRAESKAYLQCRMDAGLMGREDLSRLGYDDASVESSRSEPTPTPQAPLRKEQTGFVAGLTLKAKPK